MTDLSQVSVWLHSNIIRPLELPTPQEIRAVVPSKQTTSFAPPLSPCVHFLAIRPNEPLEEIVGACLQLHWHSTWGTSL
jgi:hypothetical protein